MIHTAIISFKVMPTQNLRSLLPYVNFSSSHPSKNTTTITVNPSKIYVGKDTSTLQELLSIKEDLEKELNAKGTITRIDFAYDTKKYFLEEIKTLVLFSYCLAVSRNTEISNVAETFIDGQKNIKFKSLNKILTIYDCSKKNRLGNTRIENRVSKLRISENEDKSIKSKIDEYIKELKNIVTNIPAAEKQCIEHLFNEWNKSRYKISTLHEFISVHNKEFLTRNILVKFLQLISYPHNIDNFIARHNRNGTRTPFDFATKDSLNKLVKDVKRELNSIAKF